MSVNKNLSKLALNLNANGDVLDSGLAVTYSSNNYVRSRFDTGDGGRFVSNNFVSDSFPSNTYITGTFTTNTYVDGRFSSNSYVTDTFSSNTFSRNASNLSEGTIPSGRLSGTYSISISGSADRVDGKDATDFISNTYAIATYTANNYVDGNFTSNSFLTATRDVYQHRSATKTFTITVDSKSSSHRYNGVGSSNGYKVDGIESPILTLLPGSTYRFDQADSSNAGHPLRFYLDAAKASSWTGGVTTNGTAGSAGAYTEITVAEDTPFTLHYQCSSHANMGNAVNIIGLETETLIIKDSSGSTVKTIRGV